ncbi:MAG: PilZ domain-containing protein [Nitrospirota bacterium]
MADKIERSSPAVGSQEEIAEKRRDERYDVSDASRQYIKLKVKSGNEFVPAILGNFSRNGILFECPVPFSKGEHVECIISVSFLLSREISFRIEVKYCYADHGSHILGASIDTISDETWFDAFVEVHDFIVLRQGPV